MPSSSDNGRHREMLYALLLLAVFLLASPFFFWLAVPTRPWYAPYLAWAAVIGLVLLFQIWHGRRRP